jgi:hypothetical protein
MVKWIGLAVVCAGLVSGARAMADAESGVTLSFGVRDCVAVSDSTDGELECTDEWVFSDRIDMSLQAGGGSCTALSVSNSLFAPEAAALLVHALPQGMNLARVRESQGQPPSLACVYGVFRLPESDAVYLPLALVETDASGKAKLLLSLAHSENGVPGVVRSDVLLKSVEALSFLGEFSLRGAELLREPGRIRYPLFGLRY